jgi:hypothetical protein
MSSSSNNNDDDDKSPYRPVSEETSYRMDDQDMTPTRAEILLFAMKSKQAAPQPTQSPT